MKKTFIYSLFFLVTLLLTFSCDEQLEEELFSSFGEGNFPTEATVETMVASNYARLGVLVVNNHRMFWATEFPTPSVMYRFRDVHPRNNLSTWTWNNDFGDPAYFEIMDHIWSTVRMSNDIIDLVPSIEMNNKKRQSEIVGEAKFLRALTYFYGVRLWGGMPIIDKAQTLDDDLYPSRATIAETYAFIIKDLKEAIATLPLRGEIEEGHATKGVAQAILAKAYITMAGQPLGDNSNLQAAKELLEEVIASGKYALVQSDTPYKDLWDWQNENNSEMMFSIQKNDEIRNFRGMFGYMTPSVLTSGIWTSGDGDSFSKGSSLDLVPPEFAKWYASHDSGPRYQWTIVTDIILEEEYAGFPAGTTMNMEDGPLAAGYIGKYRAVGAELTSNFFTPNDFPVLRYADVLLLHSEVTNELGAADYTGINAVRERAGLSTLSGLSQEAFRDAIFIERDLELTFEQKMLFDMRRRGLEYSKSKLEGFYNADQNASAPGAGDGYPQDFQITIDGEHRMLFPYPPRELSANPNLEQNPGY
ncbi:RagB/SusD family nutrient uptake outer membrane protein [Zobellia russellii]|uniref:RagB/SusD family nutrient uptake outer membrane protein n=1 Tax=Zobellia russellii TaxID=248907 RepID=UPI001BFFBDC1|nr:RagB/SusD family nutrient uptake outer membrane protein [Zobellia russellii]MBT9189566.1 RagB/SusD family nutrient uptake outer membrane protein [Zobellia russellii]